jgi:hypothetical protein
MTRTWHHPRVVHVATQISTVIHGEPKYVKAADGSCVIYDPAAHTAYNIHEADGISRTYDGKPGVEDICKRSSDAILKCCRLSPDLAKWERA